MIRTLIIALFAVVAIGIACWAVSSQATVPLSVYTPDPESQPQAILGNISAYCPGPCCCQQFSDMITASGHRIRYGDRIVAAPSNTPFGTIVEIEGYGQFTVEDRGGAITDNKLDVLFYEKSQNPNMTDIEWSHQQALIFGRKYLQVKIDIL
ncbi:hypothetical protein LCGC14_0798390 [marine sediment metagenome]|uniref:3D domain-containing protein n=1 Tax=marine sediment metagenome TaxID=412755 RepID=A0A0F9QA72_9ZZZZ